MTKYNLLDIKKFKKLAKDGEVADNVELRKTYNAEIKIVDSKKGIADFVISTEAVDRDGDTVSLDGWDLTNFKKNPVVLWAHDQSQLPVAKALDIKIENNKLVAKTEFTPADLYPFGDMVYRMVQQGFLNATSVGFLPQEFVFDDEKERKRGMDFTKAELLEYSIVPVPANPEALIEAKAKGINTQPLVDWAEQILDCPKDMKDFNLSLTKRQIEEIVKFAKVKDQTIVDLAENQKSVDQGLWDDTTKGGDDSVVAGGGDDSMIGSSSDDDDKVRVSGNEEKLEAGLAKLESLIDRLEGVVDVKSIQVAPTEKKEPEKVLFLRKS